MTPLAATPPPTTPPSASRTDANASGSGDGKAFAQALERRQAARPAEGAARTRGPADPAPDSPAPGATPDTATVPGAAAAPDQDVAEVATPAVVDIQQASPVWPPVGLAALLGFPAGVAPDAATTATGGDADADAKPPALGSVLQAAPASVAAPAITLPAVAVPDADPDLASPMPALAVDTAAPVEGGEPAPVAFTLPQTAALREPAPILAAPLPTPHVGAEDFEARFGAQLEWMADQKIGHARIRVTPHDLGPIEVRLHMDGDRVRAEFVSAQAETRQALEQGLPRLRDLLGESGFQLAHAGVGSGRSGRDGEPSPALQSGIGDAGDGASTVESAAPLARRAVVGLLDAYA